jgi:U3 small nucleolar RNA-associated protein 20
MADDLRQLGVEVRDFVQTKVGVTDFSRVWENLRRHTTEKREDRRQAKNQLVRSHKYYMMTETDDQATRDPKAYAERQGKRMVMKKDSKKRKVKSFA